jgi:hypothetical protein
MDSARRRIHIEGMTPLVLGPSRGRFALLLVVSLAFVFAGVAMALLGNDFRAVFVGWTSIVFFGACAVMFVIQLLDGRPRIIIDDHGVFDRSLEVGVIPWEEILGADVREIANNRFISLDLRDPNVFLARLSPVRRRLVEANTGLGFQPLNLNVGAVAIDPYVLAELIVKEATRRRGGEKTYRV